MEVSYHREMKKNYLMIEADEGGMQAFEAKMLVGNAIEGLLKFRIRRTDDHCQFCYEITSRQPLGRLLETKSINAVQLRALLLGIAQTLIRMEDYLLSEHQILLDPDYIYIDQRASARSVSASWKEWQFSRRIQRIFTVFTGESRPSG